MQHHVDLLFDSNVRQRMEVTILEDGGLRSFDVVVFLFRKRRLSSSACYLLAVIGVICRLDNGSNVAHSDLDSSTHYRHLDGLVDLVLVSEKREFNVENSCLNATHT